VHRFILPLAIGLGACAPALPPPAVTIVRVEAAPRASATCRYGDAAACRAACDAGDAPSCNNLGAMAEGGLVEGGEEEAMRLYASACGRSGSAGCQNALRLGAQRARAAAPPPPAPPPPPPETPGPCAAGKRTSCDALPGIHISGNVIIRGNVIMNGDVFLDGASR
jgi:hypothetical protein